MKIYIRNMACEGCKVVVKEALEELDIATVKVELGEIETREDISDEVKAQWPKAYVDYIEKFESFASVSRRMAETLKKLKQVSDKKYRVIIVTHDAVAGQLVKTFSNDELSGINPGDFLSLEKKDGKLVVTRVGDITEGNSETDVSV